jgi:hypothetical protein
MATVMTFVSAPLVKLLFGDHYAASAATGILFERNLCRWGSKRELVCC